MFTVTAMKGVLTELSTYFYYKYKPLNINECGEEAGVINENQNAIFC